MCRMIKVLGYIMYVGFSFWPESWLLVLRRAWGAAARILLARKKSQPSPLSDCMSPSKPILPCRGEEGITEQIAANMKSKLPYLRQEWHRGH